MTNPLIQHADSLLTAYSNFPQSRFISLILVRKTESETLFRTEGSGEDLSKEFVRAGSADDEIIQRVVMTKRKQTAVERRAGREVLRTHKKLYSSEKGGGECAMNGKPCGKCIDCLLYGYAVGKGDSDAVGAQKSRVMTEDSYSLLKAGIVTAKRTFTGAYEDGTMRDPENKTQASNSFVPDEAYIKPETHFLEIETLKDTTLGELVYTLGNVLRSTRYGAVSSRQGKIKNTLAGVVFSNCEIFSNLELTQHVYDLLKAEDKELNFPLRDMNVVTATNTATDALMKRVVTNAPIVLKADAAADVESLIVNVYRSDEHVTTLLAAIEQGYEANRTKAQAGHAAVLALLHAASQK